MIKLFMMLSILLFRKSRHYIVFSFSRQKCIFWNQLENINHCLAIIASPASKALQRLLTTSSTPSSKTNLCLTWFHFSPCSYLFTFEWIPAYFIHSVYGLDMGWYRGILEWNYYSPWSGPNILLMQPRITLAFLAITVQYWFISSSLSINPLGLFYLCSF